MLTRELEDLSFTVYVLAAENTDGTLAYLQQYKYQVRRHGYFLSLSSLVLILLAGAAYLVMPPEAKWETAMLPCSAKAFFIHVAQQ